MLIQAVLGKYGIDNLQLEIDLTGAFNRYLQERLKSGDKAGIREKIIKDMDLVEFWGTAGLPKELLDLRIRIEKALRLNLENEWDLPKSDWNNYDKKLLKREQETGQTIEQFMEWYNSDDFRRSGNIWLKPGKIEQLWERAFDGSDDSPRDDPHDRLASSMRRLS